jgi:hypothetical protein
MQPFMPTIETADEYRLSLIRVNMKNKEVSAWNNDLESKIKLVCVGPRFVMAWMAARLVA